jgi:transcriptional regulator with XRE-family HTH domain
MVSDRRELGERLKRQRERRGITLQQISQNTKVPVSLFAGLEAGDCSRWPAGLYARAYVRAYADAIGVNADETVEEFVAVFGSTIKAEGIDAPQSNARAANALRLSLVEESSIELDGLGRRIALAATDLLIGSLIAAIASVGLGQGVWVTAALILGYFTLGRRWETQRARRPDRPPQISLRVPSRDSLVFRTSRSIAAIPTSGMTLAPSRIGSNEYRSATHPVV